MARKSTENKDYSKSAGQTALFDMIVELYPYAAVKQDLNLRKFTKQLGYSWNQLSNEYGVSLAPVIADIVIFTDPIIILEYNGAQHYKYTSHWHGDIDGYKEAQERDNQKIWLCQRMMWPIITIAFNDDMSIEYIKKQIKEAIKNNKLLKGYSRCSICSNIYLDELLTNKECDKCIKEREYAKKKSIIDSQNKEKKSQIDKEIRAQLKEQNKEKRREEYLLQKEKNKENSKYQEQKELMKQIRKTKAEEYKKSDSYLEQKELMKQKQKEYRKSLKERYSK